MKRVGLVLLGYLLLSLAVNAGHYRTNDTSVAATGLRVVFSESVRIDGFGDAFTEVALSGTGREVIFSGGVVEPWGGVWFTYTPTAAIVERVEWLTGSDLETASEAAGAASPASATPVVTGDLLNPLYFAHGACVMQGVEDRGKVFAMPLLGVPELGFMPTQEGISPADVTWSVRVTNPTGVGAEIADGVLYIWGNNATWSGSGEVVLAGATSDGRSGSVAIPVAVFRFDRTLTSADGKKDYFVPWSPQLDINRVLSVETHMQQYTKDEGHLDRTIRFSRWRPMEYRKDVDVMTLWYNEFVSPAGGWSQQTQFALVDVFLSEFVYNGVDGIRMGNSYYFEGLTGTDPLPRYVDVGFGLTKRPEEVAYIVNEAHRLGMSVLLGNTFYPYVEGQSYELYAARPTPLGAFYDNVERLNLLTLAEWAALGVDMVEIGQGLESADAYPDTSQEWLFVNDRLSAMVRAARAVYSGPIAHYAYHGKELLEASLWESFDVLGVGLGAFELSTARSPTLTQLAEGWRRVIREVFSPFQQKYDKPFLPVDNGCFAVQGCASKWGSYCGLLPEFATLGFSMQDIRLYYLSQDAAFREMEGYFGPGWHYYSFSPYYVGSVRDPSPNPRMKVEDLIQRAFLGAAQPRIVTIDADLSDWQAVDACGTDPRGDARGTNDLTGLRFTEDDGYWYFKIDYVAPPATPGICEIHFDMNGDRRSDLRLSMNNLWSASRDWSGSSGLFLAQAPSLTQVGFADTIDSGSSIELRIAKRFLQEIRMSASPSVRVMHYDKNWTLQDETAWYPLPT